VGIEPRMSESTAHPKPPTTRLHTCTLTGNLREKFLYTYHRSDLIKGYLIQKGGQKMPMKGLEERHDRQDSSMQTTNRPANKLKSFDAVFLCHGVFNKIINQAPKIIFINLSQRPTHNMSFLLNEHIRYELVIIRQSFIHKTCT
jgi:hypothetical protein